MGFEHRLVTLGFGGAVRNAAGLATIWHNPCFIISVYPSASVGWNGFAVLFGSGYREARGVFQLNEEGIHHACFHV
jgi:hypothetical protein